LHEAFEYRQSFLASSYLLIEGVSGIIASNRVVNFKSEAVLTLKNSRVVLGLILLGGFYVVIDQI